MNNVEGIFVHLLYYETDGALTPNVACVSYIDFGVNFEFGHLSRLMGLSRYLLAPDPVILNDLVLAVVNKLIDNVIDLEAYTQGPVPHYDLFGPVEIAHEARLNINYNKNKFKYMLGFSKNAVTYFFENKVVL